MDKFKIGDAVQINFDYYDVDGKRTRGTVVGGPVKTFGLVTFYHVKLKAYKHPAVIPQSRLEAIINIEGFEV